MTWEDVLRKRFFGRRKTPDQIVDPTGIFTGKVDQIINAAKTARNYMDSNYTKIFGKPNPNRPPQAINDFVRFSSSLEDLGRIKEDSNLSAGKFILTIDGAFKQINRLIAQIMTTLKTEPEFLQGLKGALGQLASLSNGMVKI